MAEDTSTQTSQTDAENEETEQHESESQQFTPEQKALHQANEQAKRYRLELRDAQKKVKQFEDATKSEQERAQEALQAAERRAAENEAKLLRYEVAAAKDLPVRFASRLQGSTKAELEADADALKSEFGLEGSNSGGRFDGGPRRPVNKPKGMNGLIREAAGL